MPDAVREHLVADAQSLLPLPFAEVVKAEPDPFVEAIFEYRLQPISTDSGRRYRGIRFPGARSSKR